MKKHYALIGERLGHSLSQPIHEAIFQHMGVAATYRVIEIPREEFARTVPRLLDELDGFNVTIPYKQEIIPLLDALDGTARAIGAINTVVCGQPAKGYNTDAAGFKGLLAHAGIDVSGRPVYILGGGGSSRTAAASVRQLGAQSVTVVSRRADAPEKIDYARFHQLLPETGGVIVNTTPVGMWPNVTGCPMDPALTRYASGVADIVYNPPETVLTAAARSFGVPACTGLYMLVRQAVEAEAIWMDQPLPDGLTDTLMKELHII